MLLGYNSETKETVDIGEEIERALMFALCRTPDRSSIWETPGVGKWDCYPVIPDSWSGLCVVNPNRITAEQITIPRAGVSYLAGQSIDRSTEDAFPYVMGKVAPMRWPVQGASKAWDFTLIGIDENTASITGHAWIGWGQRSGWIEWDRHRQRWDSRSAGLDEAVNRIKMIHSMHAAFSPLWRARVVLADTETPSIHLPLPTLESARALLALRDTIPGQRRRALLHWVREHLRAVPSGGLTVVHEHLRGVGENIPVDDFMVSLQPAPDQASAFQLWKESRRHRNQKP